MGTIKITKAIDYIGDMDLSSTLKVYKVFTKVGRGTWLRENSALGLPVE